MWFETTRFVYFVKLKHASRTFFNLKLQRTAFHSKNAPKKCSQSSPRGPKTSPKCLRELPGDVLRGHTHLRSGPGASPIRQSGQSVVNSSKVEHPRDALWDRLSPQPLPAPRPPKYSYYYNLHLFSSYFTFCYLRLPYVYRHAGTRGRRTLGLGAFSRGLRPLPPTPKKEVVAQRILRCGTRNTSSLLVSATSFLSNVV